MVQIKKFMNLGHCIWFTATQVTAVSTGAFVLSAQEKTSTQTTSERLWSDEACQNSYDTEFRGALEALILRSLQYQMAAFDYRSSVKEEWGRLEIGKTLNEEVDRVTENIRNEMSWSALLQSLSNSEKARELATTITERVYQSDKIKESIQELASNVGRSLGTHIELVMQDATLPALNCLTLFLRSRYGLTVASVITQSAREDFQIKPTNQGSDVQTADLLKGSAGGVAGAAILVMRRQLMSLTQHFGQRVLGSVLSRLVSVVAGSIGLALIAKDMWDLRYGLLPIISEEIKSKDNKNKVQEELARALSEQISFHLHDIAVRTTDRIFTIWTEYRSAHTLVLNYAAQNAEFRAFLDTIPLQLTPRLDEITALVLSSEGDPGVLQRLSNGTLEEAIKRLPDSAIEIARQTRSLSLALDWNRIAGENIDAIVKYDFYQLISPSSFTSESLKKIIALQNSLVIKRLVSLQPDIREALFELDPATLSTLATTYNEQDLKLLGSYLTGLSPNSRTRFISLVTKAPLQFEVLKSPLIRDAVLGSADQKEAFEIILRSPDTASWISLKSDLQFILNGQVQPQLLWYAHPKMVGFGLACFFLLLLIGRRLVRPSRQISQRKK